jgi:hypothetical protein
MGVGGANEIRAGRAAVELGVNDAALRQGLETAKQRLATFGKAIQTIGSALALGFAVNKVAGWASSFAESGREIFLMARTAQISRVELLELKAAVKILGGDLEGTVGSMRKMGIFLADFATGGREAQEVMQQLGLSIADVANLSELDKLQLIGERLAAIGNVNIRQALGRTIFGREGGATVGMAGQFGAARAQARDSGLPNDADIVKAMRLSQALLALESAKKRVFEALGGAVAPVLTVAANAITGVIKQVRAWINDNQELIQKFALLGGTVAAVGTTILAVGLAAKTFMFAFAGFSTVVGAMWSLAKVTSVTYWALFALANVTKVWTALVKIGTAVMAAFRAGMLATTAAITLLKSGVGVLKVATIALTATWAACTSVMSLFSLAATAATAPLTLIPGLIGAAVVALGAFGVYLFATSSQGQRFFDSIGRGFTRILQVFEQVFGGVKSAIESGDLGLAFEIALAGMKVLLSEFNDWFGDQFGITVTNAFFNMREGFAKAVAAMRSTFALLTADLGAGFNMLRILAPALFVGGLAAGAPVGPNRRPLDAQLAEINDERNAALALINGGRPGANATAAAQQQLDDLNRAAEQLAEQRERQERDRVLAEQLGGVGDGLDQFGASKKDYARGTFSSEVLFGFGRSQAPIDRLVTLTETINQGILRLETAIQRVEEPLRRAIQVR